ncbi:MAG TPA: DUF92 domain-containing protein [Spirochaetia bacterium]|nr:DUF92 domain-containing protein [Spirochaetia bacterium]
MNISFELIFAALLLNGIFAIIAGWRRAVTSVGAATGFVVGAGILLLAGWTAWICLGAFFVTSSIASRIGLDRKSGIELIQEKGSRRDALQVLANGGVGLIAAVGFAISGVPFLLAATGVGIPGANLPSGAHLWLVALAAAFAEANADTWSSELGVLARHKPVSIISRRPILPGMSGGVTGLGFLSAAAGALLAAVVFAAGLAVLGGVNDLARIGVDAGIVGISGWIGAVLDSVLGATVQPLYIRPGTGHLTEQRKDAGGLNARIRGIPLFTNDVVNFLSTAAAAAIAAAAVAVIGA